MKIIVVYKLNKWSNEMYLLQQAKPKYKQTNVTNKRVEPKYKAANESSKRAKARC